MCPRNRGPASSVTRADSSESDAHTSKCASPHCHTSVPCTQHASPALLTQGRGRAEPHQDTSRKRHLYRTAAPRGTAPRSVVTAIRLALLGVAHIRTERLLLNRLVVSKHCFARRCHGGAHIRRMAVSLGGGSERNFNFDFLRPGRQAARSASAAQRLR